MEIIGRIDVAMTRIKDVFGIDAAFSFSKIVKGDSEYMSIALRFSVDGKNDSADTDVPVSAPASAYFIAVEDLEGRAYRAMKQIKGNR